MGVGGKFGWVHGFSMMISIWCGREGKETPWKGVNFTSHKTTHPIPQSSHVQLSSFHPTPHVAPFHNRCSKSFTYSSLHTILNSPSPLSLPSNTQISLSNQIKHNTVTIKLKHTHSNTTNSNFNHFFFHLFTSLSPLQFHAKSKPCLTLPPPHCHIHHSCLRLTANPSTTIRSHSSRGPPLQHPPPPLPSPENTARATGPYKRPSSS